MGIYMDNRASLLAGLGKRVRNCRIASGLTVAEFAQRASLSPRFVNQLEAGRGNISIANLAMAALALNRSLHELIPPDATGRSLQAQVWSSLSRLNNGELHELQQWLDKRQGGAPAARLIALVGVRLAGKSTIGRLLAKKLKTEHLELDRLIEEAAGMPVGEIFAVHGEAHYRWLERQELEKVFATSQGCVLEPGGSIVTDRDSWERIKQRCFTVWVESTPAEFIGRLRVAHDMQATENRTLGLTGLKTLLKRRNPLYAECQFKVKAVGEPSDAVAQIMKALAAPAASRRVRGTITPE
jgi:XRE family aerobic/anaerobic benzoate catabolism transcriptional regulator